VELRHLRYFVAVAEELHFGRAAARLNMAQPPLSQQVLQLEAELGVQLLRRSRRHVELTDAGHTFLEDARRILADVDRAVDHARRAHLGAIGDLSVGFVSAAANHVLPALLVAYRQAFPKVRLHLREMTHSQQEGALIAAELDVGIFRPPVGDAALTCQRLWVEPSVVVLPAAHPLACRHALHLGDLVDEAFVLAPLRWGSAAAGFLAACQAAGFNPHVVQEATELQTVLGLVASSLLATLTFPKWF